VIISRRLAGVLASVACAAAALNQTAPAGAALPAQALTGRPIILTIGESTTAGYGVPRERSYPGQLQSELDRRGYQYRVVNRGVSGSTTAMAVARLSDEMVMLPAIVIIALGGNDSGSRVPMATTAANVGRLVSMFRRIGATVFLANRNLAGDAGRDSQSIFARLADEHGAVLMPPLLTDVDGHPELLLGDGRHPNEDGYAVIVRNLFRIIEPSLKRPAAPPAP
jgi:acyl-CoA thioesterase-1